MSYGIWRKHGKGWSSIEIDTPGQRGEAMSDLYYETAYIKNALQKYNNLKSQANSLNLHFGIHDDWHQIQWNITQAKKNRQVIDFSPGYSEHQCWIAFDSWKDLENALYKLDNTSKEQREDILDRTMLNKLTTTV